MLNFAEIYIEKCEFHTSIKLIDINDVDIEHIAMPYKYPMKNSF